MSEETYKVEVKTADKMWAGTDDNVKISLYGPVDSSGVKKDTGFMLLDKSGRNDLERGDTNKFEFKARILQEIESCSILKDGRDDWNLEFIKEMISDT